MNEKELQNMCLKNYKMSKLMIKRALLLSFIAIFSAFSIRAQQRNITGTITDISDGTALVGANVIIKGTTTGTVADADGNYSIEA
jgi:hypothetical protein